ncbi:MAG: 30S ribosomal protein S8e [Nanoarchaeota archaeon]|nr:30S ribosomal protein S8e [Nanoarchaeota archaeon]
MAISQRRSEKQETGKKYQTDRGKRKKELGRPASLTKIGEKKIKAVRTLGGNYKNRIIQAAEVTILQGKKKITGKIVRVVKNPANRHFVRMNVITKGAVIETDKGPVKVTNRPGQEGQIQGILVKE